MSTITNTYTTAGAWSSTAPAGTVSATWVINGGGGGAIGYSSGKAIYVSAGGGGAETRSGSIASLTGGTILSGTIGAGGANSAVSTANATAGGSTTLLVAAVSTATANGGGGAKAANSAATIQGTGGSGVLVAAQRLLVIWVRSQVGQYSLKTPPIQRNKLSWPMV